MNKVKRIAAMVGIVLIASMYLISFISAFFASEHASGLFIASVFCTVTIPIMIWIFVTVYKWVHRSDTPEDQDGENPPE